MLEKVNNFIIITRSHQFQHIILFGMFPLFFQDTKITAYLIFYLLFFLITAFGFMINDYYDEEMDKLAGKKTSLTLGIISKKRLSFFTYASLVSSLALAFLSYPSSFWLFLIIAFLCWSYSTPPLRLKTRNWLEFPIVILVAGPLNYIYTAISVGYSDFSVNLSYFIYTLLVIGASQLNNCLKDFKGDKKFKSKNLAQKLGFKRAIKLRSLIRLSIPISLIIIYLYSPQKNIIMIVTALAFAIDTIYDSTKDFKNQKDSSFTRIATEAIVVFALSQLIK